MARILIAYSTVDGHTKLIAERIREHLGRAGHAAKVVSLSRPQTVDVHDFDTVVIGASIRYGKHRPEVFDFIARNLEPLRERRGAFFSVNVVARKPGKDTPEGNPYVRDFRRRVAWRPALLGVFAGKIDYRKYGYADRQVIRLIMWLTRGPTDPDACVDFTNWGAVETFARQVAAL